jgi:hypothetical protein
MKRANGGTSTSAGAISFEPKKWVGKCPRTIAQPEREALLNLAIPDPNGDRELEFPK